MNILIFSWRDPKHPLAGGAEQVMHEHSKGWIAAGHKVALFSSRFKGSLKNENLDGVQIIRRGHQYLGVQLAGLSHYLKNKNRYNFVVDQFHGIPFFTPLYVRIPKIAVIQEPAREVWFLNPLPRPLNWIIGAIGYLGEPFIFFLYRRTPFMTGSASAKKEVSCLGIPSKNITIVPHGAIVKKPSPFPPKEKKKAVLYLGILSKDKGIEDALDCFKILNKEGSFQFWVIGKAETQKYMQKLLKLCRKLKIRDKVRFWGSVSEEKKFRLLAKSHVLLNPSVREGWGLVNIEANAMGTPVIAYRSPGLIDSIKDGVSGVLVKRGSPKALASKVLDIFKDEKKYNRLQEGALLWSKNFNWKKSRKISLNLLQKIVNDKK